MVSPTLSSSEARLSQPHIFISVNISRCISIYLNIQYVITPLGHVCHTQPNSQIAKYPDIWLIWLFGYLAACDKHARVGYP